ncbi:hypothetical protein Taro_052645 [Colocasia esculenta]|uniref:Protein TIC 100 n=1 Tax=Colocasia esculenta TaxID=4460 RepID=A0A843XJX9_COLES|nr:hypothetical protein [Colocasia esculenta]
MAADAEKNNSGEANEEQEEVPKPASSDSDSDDDEALQRADEEDEEEEDDEYYDSDYSDGVAAAGAGGEEGAAKPEAGENSREATVRQFGEVLASRAVQKRFEDEEKEYVYHEDLFDFPRDPERWREEDLMELWADAPLDATKPGWDPVWADEEDWEVVQEERKAGRDPPIAPFYLPYRKHLPAIPDNHYDISNPKSVIEELDRIEEFLKWVSYIFPDGSSYEGTVWDDLAHGKGVYVAAEGLVRLMLLLRYEGEWLQNAMEGHGVVEVEIPTIEPVPGSKLEAKMRAEGRIIARDFMSPEDRKWMEMDIDDSVCLAGNHVEVPFYEKDEWVKLFGCKPYVLTKNAFTHLPLVHFCNREKGRYKYAGQWKHGRMHGCGVYEVNEEIIHGRFYFGEYLDDSTGCDADVSALHAGIAEVAAAKARMFVNKPDGMVREDRGPYGDPQHPYFYEEDDAWMAPGFINQFYEVPDYWKTYVEEVDQEREMWINSFYKAPLRIPMPAELEYWWAKEKSPEFVLINKEPEPDPEDPSKLIYTEDPLILHTQSGRLINYVEDEEHGVRLFWQPPLKEGEDVDPEKVDFLPLGFDEFYGRAIPVPKKQSGLMRLVTTIEDKVKPVFDRLEKWAEDKKKANELTLKLIDQELEFIEAEICLEEAIEDMEMELKMKQKEEERKAEAGKDDDSSISATGNVADMDEGEEEEEDDDEPPSSFGTVGGERTENKPGKNPFSSLSLSLPSHNLCQVVPAKLLHTFSLWKNASRLPVPDLPPVKVSKSPVTCQRTSVRFPPFLHPQSSLRAVHVPQLRRRSCKRENTHCQLNGLARILSSPPTSRRSGLAKRISQGVQIPQTGEHPLNVLSMQVPLSLYMPSDDAAFL